MALEYVLIKGAGDLASGIACVFRENGYNVVMTEVEKPTCVRRMVSFAEAVYEGEMKVEGFRAKLAGSFEEAVEIMNRGEIAVFIDPQAETAKKHPPVILIDAVIAKKNTGTSIDDAGIVVAAGPGFEAGVDAHAVIETQRGPDLGSPIYKGSALPNTGIPGDKLGFTEERVLRAPAGGIFREKLKIGGQVEEGETVAFVNDKPVKSRIGGVVRGLLKDGFSVHEGMKIGDIHPEKDSSVCFKVTGKAKTVGRGALEAVQSLSAGKFGA